MANFIGCFVNSIMNTESVIFEFVKGKIQADKTYTEEADKDHMTVTAVIYHT